MENRLVVDDSLQHFTKEQIAVKSKVGDLEFQLTQSLLDQVRVGEDNTDANSGKQACRDLPTMAFIINNRGICKETVKQWLEDVGENLDYLMRAEYAFTKMFESVPGAEVPCPLILRELIRSCNQAGYEFLIYNQIHHIFAQYKLTPTIPEKTISIRCNSVNSLNIEYNEVMVVKNSDPDQPEQYKSDNKLEFTLKLHDGKIEYENGKVTFTVPEELKKYHANGKSLLDDIKKHFGGVQPFNENAGEDYESFVEISENLTDLEELVKKAVEAKDVSALSSYVNSLESSVIRAQSGESLPIVKRIQEVVDKFAKEQGKAWGCYPGTHPAYGIYAAQKYVEGYISHEEYKIVQELVAQLECLLGTQKSSNSTASPAAEQSIVPIAASIAEPEGNSGSWSDDVDAETDKIMQEAFGKQVAKNLLATQEPLENNSNLTNNREEGKMGKNRKSGLNNKYSNGRKSTSEKGVRTKSKKEKIVIQVTGIPVEPNATANGQINTSHAQPIDPEILKLVHNMVETVSDDQTTASHPEGPSSGKGAGADDNNNGTNPCVIELDNGAKAIPATKPGGETPEQEHATVEDVLVDENGEEMLCNAEQVPIIAGTHSSVGKPSEPDKTSKNAQSTSKLPTIAVSTLLTTAVATETAALVMYFAFQASLLATGIVAAYRSLFSSCCCYYCYCILLY